MRKLIYAACLCLVFLLLPEVPVRAQQAVGIGVQALESELRAEPRYVFSYTGYVGARKDSIIGVTGRYYGSRILPARFRGNADFFGNSHMLGVSFGAQWRVGVPMAPVFIGFELGGMGSNLRNATVLARGTSNELRLNEETYSGFVGFTAGWDPLRIVGTRFVLPVRGSIRLIGSSGRPPDVEAQLSVLISFVSSN